MLGDSVSIVKELTPSLLEQLEQNILAPITSVRLGVSRVLTTIQFDCYLGFCAQPVHLHSAPAGHPLLRGFVARSVRVLLPHLGRFHRSAKRGLVVIVQEHASALGSTADRLDCQPTEFA